MYCKVAPHFSKSGLDMPRDIGFCRQIRYVLLPIILLVILAIFLLIILWKAKLQTTGFATPKLHKNMLSPQNAC